MTLTLLDQPPNISELKVHSTLDDCKLIICPQLVNHTEPLAGRFYICEDQIYFFSEQEHLGIAVEYPDIIMHAISRSENETSLFCQLDMGLFFPNQQLPDSELEREEIATELRIILKEDNAIDDIYQAMNTCASLHPDEGFTGEEEEINGDNDEEIYYTDNINEDQLNENQMATLRHLESVFKGEIPYTNDVDDSKFQDTTEDKNQE
ncbi:hypothetical protein K501DRAFT_331876 [Backusella circina FSU 941]|nr:hypothetical protein K501DRAFT_331876 [Backusella circina FSU 941]